MALPYFPLYPTDFEADTSHLTLAEDGAYNRLLRLMWMTPGCSLPDDDSWIQRRMRVDADTFADVVAPIIEEFMQRRAGRVFSTRLQAEWKKVDGTSRKRSAAGKRGGRPKVAENKQKDEKPGFDFDKAGPKHPEPEPDSSVTGVTEGEAFDPVKTLFDRGVLFLGRHGVPERQARSVIGKWRKDRSDGQIFEAFTECAKAGVVEPVSWIEARLSPRADADLDGIFAEIKQQQRGAR